MLSLINLQGLADNLIGRQGGRQLFEAIQSSNSLEKVCVFGNPFITPLSHVHKDEENEYDGALHEEMRNVKTINVAMRT